jgi:hypothetical protein
MNEKSLVEEAVDSWIADLFASEVAEIKTDNRNRNQTSQNSQSSASSVPLLHKGVNHASPRSRITGGRS